MQVPPTVLDKTRKFCGKIMLTDEILAAATVFDSHHISGTVGLFHEKVFDEEQVYLTGILMGFCDGQVAEACRRSTANKKHRIHIDHQGCEHARLKSRTDLKTFLNDNDAVKEIHVDDNGIVRLMPKQYNDMLLLLPEQKVEIDFIGQNFELTSTTSLVVTEEYSE